MSTHHSLPTLPPNSLSNQTTTWYSNIPHFSGAENTLLEGTPFGEWKSRVGTRSAGLQSHPPSCLDTGVSYNLNPHTIPTSQEKAGVSGFLLPVKWDIAKNQVVLIMQQPRTLDDQGSNKSAQGPKGLFRFLPRLILLHRSQTQVHLIGEIQELRRNTSCRDWYSLARICCCRFIKWHWVQFQSNLPRPLAAGRWVRQ